ncbi:MAG: YbjN domain-containing protein [Calditrichaeota bacterium]|nr:YbjN domain-containing protein [Calditrichota bacterium]MCB0312382.1 YbjN domain-containing protein [Calditrichota bacterium]MCB9087030.1 YbjN domain-containing protein [Calditrichia bacterium]
MKKFELVKDYLTELDISISHEDEAEEMVVIQDPENGIQNMVIDCEDPIVVLEQLIMAVPAQPGDLFKRLLQMNRTMVHGAFVLDEEGKRIIYRDTLQLENLDQNELEASIHSLGLALAEYGSELLKHAKSS